MSATTQISVHAETVSIATPTIPGTPDFKMLRMNVQTRDGSTAFDVFLPDGYLPELLRQLRDLIESNKGVAA